MPVLRGFVRTTAAVVASLLIARDLWKEIPHNANATPRTQVTTLSTNAQQKQDDNNDVPAPIPERSLFCEPKPRVVPPINYDYDPQQQQQQGQQRQPPAPLPREQAMGRAPLMVWAAPRTGSSLLLNMLDSINGHVPDTGLDMFQYAEFYNPTVQDKSLRHLERDIKKSCRPPTQDDEHDNESWYQEQTEHLYNISRSDATNFFYTLSDLPSWSNNPYYVIKMFQNHLKQNKDTRESDLIQSLVHNLGGSRKPKFLVVWRRKMIDSHVSERMARATGDWGFSKTKKKKKNKSKSSASSSKQQSATNTTNNTSNNTTTTTLIKVRLEREALDKFVERQSNYYCSVHEALHSTGADYMALEYDRDLLDSASHPNTIRQLVKFLELDEKKRDKDNDKEKDNDNGSITSDSRNSNNNGSNNINLRVMDQLKEILKDITMKKQSKVPIYDQVENWHEVVEWGYGEQYYWPDIFAY